MLQHSLTILVFICFLAACGQKTQTATHYDQPLQSNLILGDTIGDVPPRDSLIELLDAFLATKNDNPKLNPYWYPADFDRYVYPYIDWYRKEYGDDGKPCCQPTLLDILPTDNPKQYLLDIAYHGADKEGVNGLRQRGYLLAQKTGDRWFFRRPLDYFTRDWEHLKVRHIEYYVSPDRTFSYDAALAFNAYGDSLAEFFHVDPIDVTYYSCVNPVELFNIRGITENDQMHLSDKGGQNEIWSNTLYSGSDNDRYDHELVHSYSNRRFAGQMHRFIDEGLATYLGGSNGLSYAYHRKVLADYVLGENPDFALLDHLDPANTLDLNGESSVAYVLGAVCCERALRRGGKALLWSICETGTDEESLWEAFGQLGLNRDNFEEVLRGELGKASLRSAH